MPGMELPDRDEAAYDYLQALRAAGFQEIRPVWALLRAKGDA